MTKAFISLIETDLLLVWAVLFALLVAAGECGFRIGRWRAAAQRQAGETDRTGVSTVTASMFALLAFTLGLTISFAQNRFEARRDLVVQEANTIGTAWLRARLVGEPEGVAIAALIEDYAKVRLDFTTGEKASEIAALLARTSALQTEIWQLATKLARRTPTPITVALIAALNDMFDASLAQRFAFASRIPTSLAWAILVGSMLTVGAMGYLLGETGSRQVALSVLSLLMWAGAMVLIIDLNRARLGSIHVDPAPLIWTIQGFGSGAP
ncbi:MAG: hypothetical protein ACRETC_12050 [Gammaproteobacteria bacterium]